MSALWVVREYVQTTNTEVRHVWRDADIGPWQARVIRAHDRLLLRECDGFSDADLAREWCEQTDGQEVLS